MTHSEPARSIDDHTHEIPTDRRLGTALSLLTKRIDTLHLAAQPHKALLRSNLYTIGDIVRHKEKDLLAIANFGPKSLDELKKSLGERGLTIGICLDESIDNRSTDLPQTTTVA